MSGPTDIMLKHESIDAAFQDMLSAARTMESNLAELIGRLKGMEANAGQYKQAFEEFVTLAQRSSEQMHRDMHDGATALDTMNQAMRYADRAAAAGF
ncbi:hypothetical protein PUR71_37175 [Streptomyces sp. SP17BM10]|uniref:WXG100 family type VII secretion target n=1 Tax=Streptomyces sp. SP17BM10 TaxID=3002530 RepID=UPI002E79EABF|nr:hypothetical protein [Streptomyces sp. SP17BM10]MEE1788493.1 hypothetical protein [Streptomyces sp. SP17BM10]